MYSGRRREMLPYFAFIEFPCPAYKNPSDYYRMIYYRDTVNLTNVCHLNSDPLLPPPHPFHSVLLLFFSSFLILILFLLFLESELEIAADDCDIVRFSVK